MEEFEYVDNAMLIEKNDFFSVVASCTFWNINNKTIPLHEINNLYHD